VACLTPNVFDTVHRIAGYSVIALLVFRLVWGLAGTRYARFDGYPRLLRAAPRYLFSLTRGRPGRYLGLNPAGAAMAVTLWLLLIVSSATGWMSVTVRFFGVAWVEDLHSVSSYVVLALAGVHLLGVLLMGVLQRENLILAMITGRKR